MKHAFALVLFFVCVAICAQYGEAVEQVFGTAVAIAYVFGVPAICAVLFYWVTRQD